MELVQMLVPFILKVFKFLHALSLKLQFPITKNLFIEKLSALGVDVVLSKEENNILEKELVHYETSKPSGRKPVMTIYNEKFFDRIIKDRGMAFGEAYVEGWWDCDRLDELATNFLRSDLPNFRRYALEKAIFYLEYEFPNLQTTAKAYEVAEGHYDLGDTLFDSFLDPSMNYTCAYWDKATNLAEAQQHKMDLIARKLKLKPGMRVLDLGCGWGGLAQFLAQNYKVSVVGCNIAKDGCKAATERCKGLPVEIRNCDYRDMDEKFDRVVSVGMLEHVGPQNFKDFFEVVKRCLDDEGICVIHTIGCDDDSLDRCGPFSNTYIFPNALLPRATEVTNAISNQFTMEDWHNFGHDYYKTLIAWHENFTKSWPTIKHKFKDSSKFYRMWTYYLLTAGAMFKSRRYQLWHIVLSKNGLLGGYESVR